jgi:iron(III) transport system ATP-binding protein
MSAKSIRFDAVSKFYGASCAVNQVSFEIAAGSLVTLLGPSGCGKTTTLRLIAGLELATSGRIFIGDEDVTNRSASERDVSMVFQSYALFPHMTVAQNVSYGLDVRGTPKAQAREQTLAALVSVGLKDFGARLPSELSGGQQQRVAVARALVLEPAVLLFDEPLSNLDARLRRHMREEIRELQQRLGLTVVYVTHDQAEAMAVSDRIIVMDKATIAQQGSPRELYAAPASDFVAGFMGEANRVEGEVVASTSEGSTLKLGSSTVALARGGLSMGRCPVAIRPEAIEIQADGMGGLAGTVRKSAHLGGLIEYTVETELGSLFVISLANTEPHAVGARVALRFAAIGVVPIPAH